MQKMGDDSPGRGLRVASFAKLLCQVKNIEKGGSENPPQASEPCQQLYIHMDVSSDSKRDLNSIDPKSIDPKSSDPTSNPKNDPKTDHRKREVSPTSEESGRKRASSARQKSHKSEARPEKPKESGSAKSPRQSNRCPDFIFTSHASRENLVSIAVHEDEVKEARKADEEKCDQRLSKERDSYGDGQTEVTDLSLRSSRSRSPCRSRDNGEEGPSKKNLYHQRSRSRSPHEKRERNLAPKEMQDERERLIRSKNFLEEARKLMEAPLSSAQKPSLTVRGEESGPLLLPHPVPAQLTPSVDGKGSTASAQKPNLEPSVESQCLVVVERSSMDKQNTFNYPCNTVQEFESKVLKDSQPTMWVNQTCRQRNWFVECKEGESGPPHKRKWKHLIMVKEGLVTVEATASKKRDAKDLSFKLMAIKLGEILQLLKPQPGTVQSQLDEQVRVMMYEGRRVLSGSNNKSNSTLPQPLDSTPSLSPSSPLPSERTPCQQATGIDSTPSISSSLSPPLKRKHPTEAVQQAKELEKILDEIIVSGGKNVEGGSKSNNQDVGCPDEAPTKYTKISTDCKEGVEKETTVVVSHV